MRSSMSPYSYRQLNKKRLRPNRHSVLPTIFIIAAIPIIGLLAYVMWSPGLDVKDGRYDLGRNGMWLQHGWLGSDDWFMRNNKTGSMNQFRSEERIRHLAAKLTEHHIVDVFPHLCPTLSDGQLPEVSREQTESFLREFKGFRVMPWVGGVSGVQVFLEDPDWRKTFSRSIRSLLNDYPGFHGIHVNIEPCSTGDTNFLRLLEKIRKALPKNKILSVAAFPPPTLFQPFSEDHWDKNYYRKVAARADQIVVMMYNTSLPWEKPYRYLVARWTCEVLDWAKNKEVLLGVPAYNDKGVGYHHPEVEKLENALMGINEGLAGGTRLPSNYKGIAVYCEWEMDDSKWKCLSDHFVGNR